LKKFDPEVLKKARAANDWSFERVSQNMAMHGVPVSWGTIRNWENGETVPDANNLQILAVVCGKLIKDFYVEVK